MGAINRISSYDYAIINNPVATYRLNPGAERACPTNSNYAVSGLGTMDGHDYSWRCSYQDVVLDDICANHSELINSDYTLRGYSVSGNPEIRFEEYTSLYLTVIDENTTITIPSAINGFPEEVGYYDNGGVPGNTGIYVRQSGYDMSFKVWAYDGYSYRDSNTFLFTELNTDPHKSANDYSVCSRRNDKRQDITIKFSDYMNQFEVFCLETEANPVCVNGENHETLTTIQHYFVTKKGLERMMNGFMDVPLGFFSLDNSLTDYGNYTGMACINNTWRYMVNGVVDYNYTGMACNEWGWWYFRNGQLDWNYTGLACNQFGWWYYQNGNINFNYNGLAQNAYGWWCIQNGAVDFGRTGLVYDPYVGWWYVQNGAINFNYNGLVCDPYVGWWVVNDGAINFGYTGMIQNEFGWWYAVNGTLDFNATGWACNEYGWWLYYNGTIAWNYTGWWDGFYCVNGHLA